MTPHQDSDSQSETPPKKKGKINDIKSIFPIKNSHLHPSDLQTEETKPTIFRDSSRRPSPFWPRSPPFHLHLIGMSMATITQKHLIERPTFFGISTSQVTRWATKKAVGRDLPKWLRWNFQFGRYLLPAIKPWASHLKPPAPQHPPKKEHQLEIVFPDFHQKNPATKDPRRRLLGKPTQWRRNTCCPIYTVVVGPFPRRKALKIFTRKPSTLGYFVDCLSFYLSFLSGFPKPRDGVSPKKSGGFDTNLDLTSQKRQDQLPNPGRRSHWYFAYQAVPPWIFL